MTLLTFTFGALPLLDSERGTHIIHMWLNQLAPTRTDNPGDERRAAKDAAQVVHDIFAHNRTHHSEEDMRLLAEGEMPADCQPIFTFALGVTWDGAHKIPAYKQFDYALLASEPKFFPVAAVGRELYDYTFSVLKKRETADRAAANAPKMRWDAISIRHGRETFAAFQSRLAAVYAAYKANEKRESCQHRRGGYCALLRDPGCGHWHIGRCEEAK